MNEMLEKMKGKKKMMSSHEKDAKMGVLSHLRDMAQESMGSKLHGLKKVSVMSDKPEGLEMGLDKAKDMVEHMDHNEDGDEMSPNHMDTSDHQESSDPYENLEKSEGGEDEDGEHEHMALPEDELHHSPEDVDAHIAHLMSLKKHMMKKGKV